MQDRQSGSRSTESSHHGYRISRDFSRQLPSKRQASNDALGVQSREHSFKRCEFFDIFRQALADEPSRILQVHIRVLCSPVWRSSDARPCPCTSPALVILRRGASASVGNPCRCPALILQLGYLTSVSGNRVAPAMCLKAIKSAKDQ